MSSLSFDPKKWIKTLSQDTLQNWKKDPENQKDESTWHGNRWSLVFDFLDAIQLQL